MTTDKLSKTASGELRVASFEDGFHWRKMESLKFIVQISLTTAIMALCAGQLILGKGDPNDKALYWSGITGILAWWMPSPGNSSRTEVE